MRDRSVNCSESVGAGDCEVVPAWLRAKSKARDCPPCEARAGGRTRSDDVRLSIAHTDRAAPLVPPNTFRYWPGASLAMIPAGENKNPNASNSSLKNGIRGIRSKITTLSKGARRRIVNYLSTVSTKSQGYTFSLTLPKHGELLPPDIIHRHFLRLARNFTASSHWRHVGAVYKREFQKRGALHYHFAFYGIKDDAEAIQLQLWLSKLWIELVCSQLASHDSTRKRMMRVHMHPKNMQRIRTTISSYFAKYLGKDEGAPPVEVSGKWWGKLNEVSIPVVEEKQLVIPAPVRDKARRWASELQGKRVQYGLFRSAMLKAGLWFSDSGGNKVLAMSLQEFHQAKNPISKNISKGSLRYEKLFDNKLRRQRLINEGYRPGSYNRPRPSKFGKITLVGCNMPVVSQRMIRHAADLWKYDRENHKPF